MMGLEVTDNPSLRELNLSYPVRLKIAALESGQMKAEEVAQVEFAQGWIARYFETHHQPLPRSRWGKPIIVDYR